MNAPIAAALLCLFSQLAAAQGVAAAATGPAAVRHVEIIATASASPQRGDGQPARALSAHDGVAVAHSTPAEAPRGSGSGERDLLLAGLALMAGIALRRYSAGPR